MTVTRHQSIERPTVGSVADRLRSVGIAVEVIGDERVEVGGITHDSRSVASGNVFACFRGERADGHVHAANSVAAGAVALLVDHRLTDVADVPQLVVSDTRRAVGPASAAAWGDPADRMITVGITGTNGKTTTAQIVAAMLESCGVSTGVVGTLHGPRTTPEAPDLHRALAAFADEGRGAVVMEVSSHALALHRVDGTRFDVVAFTNFGHDHLDLHGSPEAYFRAKAALFTPEFAPVAVVNIGDPHGQLLADSIESTMDVVEVHTDEIDHLEVTASGHRYRWRDRDVMCALGGRFNVDNSLLSLHVADRLDVDLDRAVESLASLDAIPGRFEIIDHPAASERGIIIVVDYAHTPDGLEVLLRSARSITQGRLVSVFGCAGNRDREKRPVMGEVAARLSDIAIATSDNPRGEDPDTIIDDVLAGVADDYRSRVTRQQDRRLAVRHALDIAERGDVVVIAGKGHETSQDLGHEVVEFDDRAVARDELDRTERHDAQ